jgi:hypothetical protein
MTRGWPIEAVRREAKLEQSDDDDVAICPPLSIYPVSASQPPTTSKPLCPSYCGCRGRSRANGAGEEACVDGWQGASLVEVGAATTIKGREGVTASRAGRSGRASSVEAKAKASIARLGEDAGGGGGRGGWKRGAPRGGGARVLESRGLAGEEGPSGRGHI